MKYMILGAGQAGFTTAKTIRGNDPAAQIRIFDADPAGLYAKMRLPEFVAGTLPEAKQHCSVMGMEALQSAIANYRGEPDPFAAGTGDHEGKLICKCFGVTDLTIIKVARENQLKRAEDVTNYCKAGGACGACLDEIQHLLDDMWKMAGATAAEEQK